MTQALMEKLKGLPRRSGETWQGGLFRMPGWVTREDREPYRPYAPLWVAVRDDKVGTGQAVPPEERNPRVALNALLDFACHSEFGGYRPGRVEVCDPQLADFLSGQLGDAEIEVRLLDRLRAVEEELDSMEAHLSRGAEPIPGPLDAAGVTVEHMRRFADAAAEFYRAAPWQYLTDVDLIRIEEPTPPRGMGVAVVLGAGRSVYGLGLYTSARQFYDIHRPGADSARGPSPRGPLWHVAFGDITDLPLADADLWEDESLPVAGPQAYPMAMKLGGPRIARPGAAELSFLEGLLRALAETTEAEIDSGRWQKQVTTLDGDTTVELAIPDLLRPPSHQGWIKRGFMPDRRAHERMYADMDRYFREHPPESPEQMNETLARVFTGKRVDQLVTQPETPAERAQDLCFDAFATHGRRRVQLARQALEISPDCADAYVILAEQSGTFEAQIENYRRAVEAAGRALGPEAFEENAGRFWGVSSTRPYMRARFGLAQSLEQSGRIEEAVEHYQELLRLNPNDNQGVRYLLMPRLIQSGRDAEAGELLKSYDERSANWAYARALLAFRSSGTSSEAGRELREAFRTNPHVPEFLLEERPMAMPGQYSPGSPEEAMISAEELRPAFQETEGALPWLAAEFQERPQHAEDRRRQQRKRKRQKKRKRR